MMRQNKDVLTTKRQAENVFLHIWKQDDLIYKARERQVDYEKRLQ